jgi:hypothetical protein
MDAWLLELFNRRLASPWLDDMMVLLSTAGLVLLPGVGCGCCGADRLLRAARSCAWRGTIRLVEQGDREKRSYYRWAWLILTALGVVAVITTTFVLLDRHHRLTRERELEVAKQRAREQRELEQRKRVTGLIQVYMRLKTMAWRERDRTLGLIQAAAQEPSVKKWVKQERERLAPYLKRLAIVERYNRDADRLSLSKEKVPPEAAAAAAGKAAGQAAAPSGSAADGPEALQDARKSPHWRAYLRLRERLRLRNGKYCCKIATGRLLFTRAGSIKGCRGLSQKLCDALALTAPGKQKCFYTVTTDCTSGEVIAVGDVDAEAEQKAEPRAKVTPAK